MMLTDTHTHLYYTLDEKERAEQMERCLENQITRLFLPNVSSQSVGLVMNLVKAYPKNCFPMLGLHPCDVNDDFLKELDLIHQHIKKSKIYAIGEIGIDLYWDKTFLKQQQDAFTIQIEWAKTLNLPIVIHCRDAFDEVFEILENHDDDKLRGIFHCFTGNLSQAKRAIDLGFYLGIGGVVTYKNAGLDKTVEQIDLKNIVLETDAPYLAPSPYRGKPNESSYLIHIAQKIADLKQIPLEEVAKITTANSVKIFGV
ncbi:TatD family hydrolase [Pedobacter sp. SD-b]|uniref:TatD family hydrolase n=1 Tax=Pedobacter segetis TaxID=2793069 RepID=A0ABS1BGV7_9SPHI|nr:TatD family hydrolase [Pedobacter segetis]MBK0382026.1 TatD family hydrolase [Pedobacter segetis]